MKLDIELSLAQQINTDAEDVLGLLQTAPENSSDVSDTFRPNHLQTTASLFDPEIPSGPVQFTIGINKYSDGNKLKYLSYGQIYQSRVERATTRRFGERLSR